MSIGTLLIRADASVKIATGHVMRCLALAQAWDDTGGTAVFAMAESTPAILRTLARENFAVVSIPAAIASTADAKCTIAAAKVHNAAWIVADGYSFDRRYQRAIKDAGFKLLCVDDVPNSAPFFADILLNQNLHACASSYSHLQPETRLLLGPRFAMLRREFRAAIAQKREIPERAKCILITMGGSDPENLTSTAIQAASLLNDAALEFLVVAGGSNPHIEQLRAEIESSGSKFRLEVDPSMLPDLMAHADVAVASSGATSWELCALGLPAIVVDAAPNQRLLAETLARKNVAVHITRERFTAQQLAAQLDFLIGSPQLRSVISSNGSQLVDGLGARRVAAAMQETSITVPCAKLDDRPGYGNGERKHALGRMRIQIGISRQ